MRTKRWRIEAGVKAKVALAPVQGDVGKTGTPYLE